ncbi:MAG: hypothetical protein FWE05_03010 [Defluviitaleaceae bacterium]|nr:hypothetical protein [Defluviitaleaceae bacterium]
MGHIKCRETGENICLTFNWQSGIEQVYIFVVQGNCNNFDVNKTSLSDGRLFTLQEYKKRGGCVIPKKPGVFTYYICPFLRENVDDIFADEQMQITHTSRINIDFVIQEKIRRHKIYEISIVADYPVARGVLKYIKEPIGVEYTFSEISEKNQPITWIVRTEMNENLKLFIDEAFVDLYNLRG